MTINFPDTSNNNPSTGSPWADGDTTTLTADGVQITYEFKTQDDDHWWKSLGRVNLTKPTNEIRQGDSAVTVEDTSTDGRITFTIDNDVAAKLRNDKHFVIGGNVDTDPKIELADDGSANFDGDVSTPSRFLAGSNGYGATGISLNSSVGSIYCRPSTTNTSAFQVYSGTGGQVSDIEFQVNGDGKLTIGDPTNAEITLNPDGSASFAGNIKINEGTSEGVVKLDGKAASGSTGIHGSIQILGGGITNSPEVFSIFDASATRVSFKGDGSASFANKITFTDATKGIQFEKTDSGGAITSQTLDDYEEGTWTPELRINNSADGITGTQVGRYTKVGNIVTCNFTITLTSKGSSTGQVLIANLPFASAGGNENRIVGTIGYYTGMTNLRSVPFPYGAQNSTLITLQHMNGADTGSEQIDNTNFGDTLDLRGQIIYATT